MDSIYRRFGNDPFFFCFGAEIEILAFLCCVIFSSVTSFGCNCAGNLFSSSSSSVLCFSLSLSIRLFSAAAGKLRKWESELATFVSSKPIASFTESSAS